jgi:hypothetical protein
VASKKKSEIASEVGGRSPSRSKIERIRNKWGNTKQAAKE